jgi:site-specific recombinase XerD
MAQLLYGSGLRIVECVRMRVKDVDLARHQILVRDGKGNKDRSTVLPDALLKPLTNHLSRVRQLHKQDLAENRGAVFMPSALATKYPRASKQWIWQYVFPSPKQSIDPRSGVMRRHHIHPSSLQKAVR